METAKGSFASPQATILMPAGLMDSESYLQAVEDQSWRFTEG
jgi:hypothetical protein